MSRAATVSAADALRKARRQRGPERGMRCLSFAGARPSASARSWNVVGRQAPRGPLRQGFDSSSRPLAWKWHSAEDCGAPGSLSRPNEQCVADLPGGLSPERVLILFPIPRRDLPEG